MEKVGVEKNLLRMLDYYLPPVLYAAMIFFLSSKSFETVDLQHGMDKAVHLLIYAGFGYVVLRALRKSGCANRTDHWAIWIVLCYGIGDEYHQSFVPGRYPDLIDTLYDGLGGLTAVVFCRIADRFSWPIWF